MFSSSKNFFHRVVATVLLVLIGLVNPLSPLAVFAAENAGTQDAGAAANAGSGATTETVTPSSEATAQDPKASDLPGLKPSQDPKLSPNSVNDADPSKNLIDPNMPSEGKLQDPNDPASLSVEDPLAQPDPQNLNGPTPLDIPPNLIPSQAKVLKPDIDQSTGALQYSYPFTFPAGKNNLTPELSLHYNSQNTAEDSIVGYGWSLSIPTVERGNLHGTDKLYNSKDYVSSISGELVEVSPNVYAPKNDQGDFLTYTFSNNAFSAKNKEGMIYSYGLTAGARQDDPNNANNIYQWALEKIQDSLGNYITYTYYKDQGTIYPDKITYAHSSNNAGIYEIDIVRQSWSNPYTSYKRAFAATVNYLLQEVDVKVNGIVRYKYAFTFTGTSNNNRALLSSIKEIAYDSGGNNPNSKPNTTFSYQTKTPGWTENPAWVMPLIFNNYNGTNDEQAVEFIDANGDGLQDVVKSRFYYNVPFGQPNITDKQVYLNTGNGWQLAPQAAVPPVDFIVNSSTDCGVRIGDVNGDMLTDLLQGLTGDCYNNNSASYLNNGNGWTNQGNFNLPEYFKNAYGDTGLRLVDVNGDGLPDLLRSNGSGWQQGDICWSPDAVYINNGTGFTYDQSWAPLPEPTQMKLSFNGCLTDVGTRFMDINHDGLTDITRSFQYSGQPWQRLVYLNNGHGWNYNQNLSNLIPAVTINDPCGGCGLRDTGVRIIDVNGDGIQDMSQALENNGIFYSMNSWINNLATTNNFNGNGSYKSPLPFIGDAQAVDPGVRIADVNSDGLEDIVQALLDNGVAKYHTYLSNGAIPDLLSTITVPTGGTIAVTYKSSAQYRDAQSNLLNPHLPMVIQTVESITETDPITNLTATTHYLYENGSYYYNGAFDRKFAGFEKVTTIRPDSSKIISYYHQGNTSNAAYGETADHSSKIGMTYRQDILDSQGNLYTRQTTLYDYAALPSSSNNRFFVFKTQEMNEDFDGNQTGVATAATYVYDQANGNLTQSTNFGDVTSANINQFNDNGTDKRFTFYTYATNNQGQFKISMATHKDFSLQYLGQESFQYDNLPLGQLSNGLLTSHNRWVDLQQYQTETYTYDSTGFILTQTDPLNAVTTYTPDAYKLYPVTIKNALNQTVQFTYDYATGQPLTYTDQNGKIYTASYDNFGRITSYTVPLAGSPTKITRSYNDTPDLVNHLPVSVTTTNYLQANQSHKSYVLFDGFGRTVRTLEGDDTGANCYNSDTTYDQLGNTNMSSLPYAGSCALSYTAVAAPANLKTTYSYDTLGRKLTAVNVLGTTTMQYDDRVTTITDPLNHAKKMTADALGRLVKVTEKLGNQNYDTLYSYDLNNNLTQITDALLNVRNFTYDFLGNRLTATDLHAPADSAFGTWTETYQLGMLKTSTTQPTGLVISYGYDSLHRLTSKTGGNGQVNETYVYDNCPVGSVVNGTGKLCTVTSPTTTQTYAYDAIGRTTSESLTMNSQTFVTGYSYDYDGHPLTVTQPNGEVTTNTYTNRGLPLTVSHNGQSVVTNVTYNEIGAPMGTTYGNGSTTTKTYDPNKLYRLSTIKTVANGVTVQNTAYTYDAIGNLLTEIESSTNSPYTASYTYDELDRMLTGATTSGGSGPGGTGSGSQTVTRTYTYDILGNILTSPAGNYTYGGNVGVGMYANPHGATQIGANKLRYDQNGNVTKVGSNIYNSTLYYYDYQNHVRSVHVVQNIGGMPVPMNVAGYGYTPDGARVVKELSGGASTTIYPTKSYETDGTTTTIRLFLGSQEVGTVEKVGAGAATRRYIHPDNLGGSRVITDSAGNNAQTLYYQPFGEIRVNNKTGTYDEKRKYTGHLHDDETNLEFMEARYYNAQWGRFTSEDPLFLQIGANQESAKLLLDPQSLNSYAYARNNPLKYVDPDGRAAAAATMNSSWAPAFETITNGLAGAIGKFAQKAIPIIGAAISFFSDTPSTKNSTSDYEASLADEHEKNNSTQNNLSVGGANVASTSPSPINSGDDKNKKGEDKSNKNQTKFSDHAIKRMTERNINKSTIENLIKNIKPFDFLHEGTIKNGFFDPVSRIFASQSKTTGTIITVMNNVKDSYINGLKNSIKP